MIRNPGYYFTSFGVRESGKGEYGSPAHELRNSSTGFRMSPEGFA